MKKKRKTKINKIAVIGAGSWGTALSLFLAEQGNNVVLWAHRPEHIEDMEKNRENKKYLPGFPFPDNLNLNGNINQVVKNADCVLMVVPSHAYKEVFLSLFDSLEENSFLVSASKGLEKNSLKTMTEVMEDVAEKKNSNKNLFFGALSGPSFAKEVAAHYPTAVTIAFSEKQAAMEVQNIFQGKFFRSYSSNDVVGVEISGVMKNVIAIAAGISDGLGFGLNSRAALITRGLAEITRMGCQLGANPLTFAGLSGMGDLVLTCTGDLSRNRQVGLQLGKGKKLDDILAQMNMVAEGVINTASCYELAQKIGVEMPILEQTYQVLYQGKKPVAAVSDLFKRNLKEEL